MSSKVLIVVLLNSIVCFSLTVLPPQLKFGAATAAYQIEGGCGKDDKGKSIWDIYAHSIPSPIKDHSTGDVACDSYDLWKEDIKMIKFLNLHFYRFSISWTRILPSGFSNRINSKGIEYYNKLINSLLENGIEPMITLYHWDLPQNIQILGGWTNSRIVDYFADYAAVVFRFFGDRVSSWITINEPSSICRDVYEYGNGAPGLESPGIGTYICGKNVLLAHAKVYRLYQEHFKNTQRGRVGITIDSIWAEPFDEGDEKASDIEMQMSFGWFANPIFSKMGDYPDIMKTTIAKRSSNQNFTTSRLPAFTDAEIAIVRGSADFLGLNHYHTWAVSNINYSVLDVSFDADKGTYLQKKAEWKDPDVLPWGFRKLLVWIKKQYDNPLVYVTENGFADSSESLDDQRRVYFLESYISALCTAIQEDGCNITRYAVWSLMDNMEWTDGYTIKYGLFHTNFSSSYRNRTKRSSAFYYKGICSLAEPSVTVV
ncbi:hypothetical protein GWI33_018669 [Rhynchophorus ferrugineus]|uniref:beta-glucosidase n=1 Tax=Rhynchophorus ferrugineus TaxID=354439 RepID=A0A834HUI3_RHYFE|nr:hypothetical protein GWI33_018669 [Rhynchophorus ferrugineus]